MEARVYLRAFEPEDYKTSVEWRNDDEIWSMLGGRKYFVSSVYEKKWIEDTIFSGKDVKLAVCLKDNEQYIGNVYLTDIDYVNRSAVSHVLIGNKSYWGNGYAAEAYKLLLAYAFDELGLHRVCAMVLESNIGSLKMHKKCGYNEEGVLRDSVWKNGKFQNQIILSIMETDFRDKLKDITGGGNSLVCLHYCVSDWIIMAA